MNMNTVNFIIPVALRVIIELLYDGSHNKIAASPCAISSTPESTENRFVYHISGYSRGNGFLFDFQKDNEDSSIYFNPRLFDSDELISSDCSSLSSFSKDDSKSNSVSSPFDMPE